MASKGFKKPEEQKVFHPIADGYAKLECLDLRVDRVMLTQQKYLDRMQHHYHVDFDAHATPSEAMDNIELRDGPPENGARLWGAEIVIGHKNGVFSEPQFGSQFEPIEFVRYYSRGGLTIIVKSRAQPLYQVGPNEWTAIETLREMITEAEFRKFLAHGFILVPGKSGKVYQIFRNKNHTRVWRGGKLVEEVCVYIPDRKIPPTDKLVALKTMIETDEEEFRKSGNVYQMQKAA